MTTTWKKHTRGGYEILAGPFETGQKDKAFIGLVQFVFGSCSVSWTLEGKAIGGFKGEDLCDLVPAPETRTVWVNVYADGDDTYYQTEENAKKGARWRPEALIRAAHPVTFELPEKEKP